jgi:putative MATE family efflux protein
MEESKLGVMPIPKLLASMSFPMMISFFIQALYNIVDSMFVAQISEQALTAVSLAYPMQQVANAIAVGLGVGMSALMPRFAGTGNMDKANRTAHVGIFLNMIFYLIFLILGLTAVHAIYAFQTDVEEIVNLGTIYLTICWCVSIGVFSGQYFEKMLVANGNAMYAMIAQASGAVFNIVFDPLLIFGIGPFPQLGIAGAAWATVMGQIVGALVGITMNMRKNTWVHFRLKDIHYDHEIAGQIFQIGLPSMITIGLNSLTSFFVNIILLGYSTTAAAVYGIWIKLQNFCFMPLFGLNNGMIPILSYNQAQNKIDRVRTTNRLATVFALIWMIILTVVLELYPGSVLHLFNASDHMMAIGLPAMRCCVASLIFGGICIVRSTMMQALDHAQYTLILNILRQFVIIVSAFYILSKMTDQLALVWLAVPITEMICFVIAAIFYRRMVNDLERGTNEL